MFRRKSNYSKIFWRTYRFLQKSKYWEKEKLEEYQWLELKKILKHAYKNTKYYRKRFTEYGITPDDIKDLDDFSKKVPILTKDEVRENLKDMIALPQRKLKYVTTGGSTGMPLGFYLEKGVTYQKTLAYEWRHFNEGGYYFGDRIAVLRGRVMKKDIFAVDKKGNRLFLSTFDMTEENMHHYVELIYQYKPKHIRAYPSAAEIFSKFVLHNYPSFNDERFVDSLFTSSETLYDCQRSLIEKVLKLKVFNKYGNSEQCGIISQCRHGQYHENMEYAYSEFLYENNNKIEKGKRRLVSTSFVNYAVPFIRYYTGDLLELDDGLKCECGMNHTTIKRLVGRWNKHYQVVGKNGNLISLTALNTHSDVFDSVYRIQYVQTKKGVVTLRVVPKWNYTNDDKNRIISEMSLKFRHNVDLILKEVKNVELTQAGKHKLLIQRLSLESDQLNS